MASPCRWHLVYGLLVGIGLVSMAFAYQQYGYMQRIAAGNRAVEEKRVDTQDYNRAGQYWLARQDIVLTNQGILAYEAKNYPRAADLFRRSRSAPSSLRSSCRRYTTSDAFSWS
jgi:hypothetical protein